MLSCGTTNNQSFERLEVRCYAGEGTYRMEDEQGGITFAIGMTEEGAVVSITPDADSVTREIKVTVVGAPLKEIRTIDGARMEKDSVFL